MRRALGALSALCLTATAGGGGCDPTPDAPASIAASRHALGGAEHKLLPTEVGSGHYFGRTVDISDNVLVAGEYRDGYGEVRVFRLSPDESRWELEARFDQPDLDPDPEDNFAVDVAVADGTVVSGAPRDNESLSDNGALHVFERVDGAWDDVVSYHGGAEEDHFGERVDVSGEHIVVGAPGDYYSDNVEGRAYIVGGPGWSTRTELVPSSPKPPDEQWGSVVAVGDGTAAIGLSRPYGRVWVFDEGPEGWQESTVLSGSGRFGASLSLAPGLLAVGLPYGTGAVSLYVESAGGEWEFDSIVAPPSDAAEDASFGEAVSLAPDGERLAVGAPEQGSHGAVHLFAPGDDGWTHAGSLEASDGRSDDDFGSTVAIDGDWVAVGAPEHDEAGEDAGAVYVYRLFADADGDGVADPEDGCPEDPEKTDPGTCGCGASDADPDYDGVPSCNDGCPYDAEKTEPGTCGCNVAEGSCGDGGAPQDAGIDPDAGAPPQDGGHSDGGDAGVGPPDGASGSPDGSGGGGCTAAGSHRGAPVPAAAAALVLLGALRRRRGRFARAP